MSILILSHYGDVHAEAIGWALDACQIPAVRWTVSNFPSRQRITASISRAQDLAFDVKDHSLKCGEGTIDNEMLNTVTAVWNRRLGKPAMHAEIDQSYSAFAKEEVRRFVTSLPLVVAPNAVWINTPEAERAYEAKLPQLVQARRAGLAIPDTVITNDPTAVRTLCQKHNEIVYKAFRVPSWRTSSKEGGRLSITFTTPLTPADIEAHADAIEFAPGIFQQLIRKRSELRVVVLGSRIIAGRIHSQETEATKNDWRAGQSDLRVEKVELRPELEQRIRAFMAGAGLEFGCIDLIEPLEGEEIFLEVNQMGQFLWMDKDNPEMRVMEAFCSFLAATAGYGPIEDAMFPAFQEFKSSRAYARFVNKLDQEQAHHQYMQTYEVA